MLIALEALLRMVINTILNSAVNGCCACISLCGGLAYICSALNFKTKYNHIKVKNGMLGSF